MIKNGVVFHGKPDEEFGGFNTGSGFELRAEYWKDGELICAGDYIYGLYFNHIALALISLGNKMNCNEINVKLNPFQDDAEQYFKEQKRT